MFNVLVLAVPLNRELFEIVFGDHGIFGKLLNALIDH